MNMNFDSHIAGAKTFWIICFKNNPGTALSKKSQEKPVFDFLIPSPMGQNQWMQVIDTSTKEALESLENIQKLCGEIKEDCQIASQKPEEGIKKAKKVKDELSALDGWIKHFNDLMKRFKNFPPEDKSE